MKPASPFSRYGLGGLLALSLLAAPLQAAKPLPERSGKNPGALQEEIEALKLEIEFLNQKVSDSRSSIRKLETRIKNQRDRVQGLQDQIGSIASESQTITESLDGLSQDTAKNRLKYDAVLTRFRNRLVQIHQIKQSTLVNSIFSAQDLNAFLNRYQMVRHLLVHDRKLLTDLTQARDELSASVQTFQEKQTKLTELAGKAKKNREEFLLEMNSLLMMMQTLVLERKTYLAKQEKLKREMTDLESEIGAIEKLRVRDPERFEKDLTVAKAGKPNDGKVKPPAITSPGTVIDTADAPPVKPLPVVKPAGARFIWPLKEIRDTGLKPGDPPPKSLKLRPGTDREVLAADAGKVMFKGPVVNFGNMIILSHKNGYNTVYGYLADLWVGIGSVVETGEVIGSLGDQKEPQLHFEIRLAGTNQDPLVLLPKLK
jgi:septal ring factor EnvC (AmiA/AmiB activator)